MADLKETTVRNGYYALSLRDLEDGGRELLISVHAPLRGGTLLSFNDEKPTLEHYLPEITDWVALARAFETRKGSPETIATTGDDFSLPGFVFASLSRDVMSASILFTEPIGSGPSATVEQALEKLENQGVVSGTDRHLLEKALASGDPQKPYLVAEGTPPLNGDDSRIEYLVTVGARNIGPRILADGSVDLKNVMEIDSVVPGQAIARKIPAGEGTDGTTLTGEAIKARPGRDMEPKIGKGVQYSPDDLLVLEATIEGEVSVSKSGLIEVRPVYEVRGDVNYATGNVTFKGNVVIHGDVASGFTVETTGDIRIAGTVEDAEIIAGGDVTVLGGFIGQDKGRIRAVGTVTVAFVQSGTIITDSDVFVARGIINSTIDCRGEVIATGRKGAIMGGRILAERGVQAKVIGNEAFTPTIVSVGLKREVVEELQKINNRLTENRRTVDEAAKGLKTLDNIEKTTGLDDKKLEIRKKLSSAVTTMSRAVEEDEVRLKELDEIITQSRRAKVTATDLIYPGVHLFFSVSAMKVTDPLHGVAVVEFNEEATFFPLKDS